MSNENKQLATIDQGLQMMPLESAQGWYKDFAQFTRSILKEDLDFGVIPGTPKPSLYKPGAEKLRFVYGLSAGFDCIDKIVDLDRPFVDYTYRCTITSKTGQMLAQCEGSCNSLETKFGYLWKTIKELPDGTDITKLPVKTTGKKISEFEFAIDKAETTGQYGKPAEYWQKFKDAIDNNTARSILRKTSKNKELAAWEIDETVTVYRILNPDVIGMKNTIMKMAQKRAFVGAMLLATGASEFFTQDIEDMEINGQVFSNEKNVPIEDADVITDKAETIQNPGEEKPFVVPGHWYAKLERCKNQSDVLNLYSQHKATVDAHPELQKLFKQTQEDLKKEASHV